ncbi:MAG: hypothetical protein ACI4CE_07490 [Methanomethylophilus alvi]
MNTRLGYRNEVVGAAMAMPKLRTALEGWYRERLNKGFVTDDFVTWLHKIIDMLAGDIAEEGIEPTVEWMVNALKVQVGPIPSVDAVVARDRKSFDLEGADFYSYIEDEMVYVSVWYKGKNASAAAESTKDFFEANGYAVRLCKVEEIKDEITVCAQKFFDGKEVK